MLWRRGAGKEGLLVEGGRGVRERPAEVRRVLATARSSPTQPREASAMLSSNGECDRRVRAVLSTERGLLLECKFTRLVSRRPRELGGDLAQSVCGAPVSPGGRRSIPSRPSSDRSDASRIIVQPESTSSPRVPVSSDDRKTDGATTQDERLSSWASDEIAAPSLGSGFPPTAGAARPVELGAAARLRPAHLADLHLYQPSQQ